MLPPGVSDGSTIGLNLKGSLYLGGVDPNVRVARGVGIDTGFVGCVSEVSHKLSTPTTVPPSPPQGLPPFHQGWK